MTQWEFEYFDLYLGEEGHGHTIRDAHEEIARLGAEGWEPVGPVTFEFFWDSGHINLEQLMFKRPKR